MSAIIKTWCVLRIISRASDSTITTYFVGRGYKTLALADGLLVSINADGWIKIMNRDPVFSAITYEYDPENAAGIPIWIKCAIYRTDRRTPIEVKEYFDEVKPDWWLEIDAKTHAQASRNTAMRTNGIRIILKYD